MASTSNSASRRRRVLFVCTANEQRSPTAERMYRGRADLEVASAGVAATLKREMNEDLLDWADVVYVMEPMHVEMIEREFPGASERTSIRTLHIPDRFFYMDTLLSKTISDLASEC